MTMTSARHALPLLQAGQAQKELHHNEALVLLDLAVHPVVQQVGRNDPPEAAEPGQAWIVGAEPGGARRRLARLRHMPGGNDHGGWRFLAPQPGMTVWSVADGCNASWNGSEWRVGELVAHSLRIEGEQVVGPRQPAIGAPAGGAVVDMEARAALQAVLAALTAHGLIHP